MPEVSNAEGFLFLIMLSCKYCNKEISNKGALILHENTCKRIYPLHNEIIDLYCNKYKSIKFLSVKYKVGKNTITDILKDKVRDASEAGIISHKLYPDTYKHSNNTKEKIKKKRLEYMKKYPERTAWRKPWPSITEQLFLDKLLELKWHEKYRIEFEKRFSKYVCDFVIIDKRLCIEIDGPQHNLPLRKKVDNEKDSYLRSLGWEVIRFSTKEIKSDIDSVFNELDSLLKTIPVHISINPGLYKGITFKEKSVS